MAIFTCCAVLSAGKRSADCRAQVFDRRCGARAAHLDQAWCKPPREASECGQPCRPKEFQLHDASSAPRLKALQLLQGFQLGGLLAAVAAGAIGGIPFMGGEDRRTYERYHLKRDSKTRA